MLIPLFITQLILFLYIFQMILLLAGLLTLFKRPVKSHSAPAGEVTVVIPFKDELVHLQGVIKSLRAQTYPKHLFSVILVNDHSSDGSGELAASLIKNSPGFSCFDLPKGKEGKKEAISFALSRAHSPWILQTDADCRFGAGFISSHMDYLNEHPSDMVAGLVSTMESKGGFLETFERLDLLALNGAGAGSFPFGRAIMCSGANMLYSRELYRETRRFDPVGKTESGDDMFLLIGARKLQKKVAFNPDRQCIVYTVPTGSFKDLLAQRIRWGAKSVFYRMPDIQWIAFLVAAANLMILLSPVWMIINPSLTSPFLISIGAKFMADFLILVATSLKTGQTRSLWLYIPIALIYPFFMAMLIGGLLIKPSKWKERIIQESFLR